MFIKLKQSNFLGAKKSTGKVAKKLKSCHQNANVKSRRNLIKAHEKLLDLPFGKYKLLLLFLNLTHSKNFLSDPHCWLREDVEKWLQNLIALEGLPEVHTDRFLMNGKALCLMTMQMFCKRVPLGGKLLYKDFQLRLSIANNRSANGFLKNSLDETADETKFILNFCDNNNIYINN